MCNYHTKTQLRFVETYFSGEVDLALKVVELVKSAQTSIDVMMFSFTEDRIIDSLIEAQKRGIKIRVIIDCSQANGKSMKTQMARLVQVIPIRVSPSPKNFMHIKTTIIDNRINTTGSMNQTIRGNSANWERLDIIYDKVSTKTAQLYFQKLWENITFVDYKIGS